MTGVLDTFFRRCFSFSMPSQRCFSDLGTVVPSDTGATVNQQTQQRNRSFSVFGVAGERKIPVFSRALLLDAGRRDSDACLIPPVTSLLRGGGVFCT